MHWLKTQPFQIISPTQLGIMFELLHAKGPITNSKIFEGVYFNRVVSSCNLKPHRENLNKELLKMTQKKYLTDKEIQKQEKNKKDNPEIVQRTKGKHDNAENKYQLCKEYIAVKKILFYCQTLKSLSHYKIYENILKEKPDILNKFNDPERLPEYYKFKPTPLITLVTEAKKFASEKDYVQLFFDSPYFSKLSRNNQRECKRLLRTLPNEKKAEHYTSAKKELSDLFMNILRLNNLLYSKDAPKLKRRMLESIHKNLNSLCQKAYHVYSMLCGYHQRLTSGHVDGSLVKLIELMRKIVTKIIDEFQSKKPVGVSTPLGKLLNRLWVNVGYVHAHCNALGFYTGDHNLKKTNGGT